MGTLTLDTLVGRHSAHVTYTHSTCSRMSLTNPLYVPETGLRELTLEHVLHVYAR